MSNCKDCGREEWGFLSALDDDGYCYSCAAKHNKEKIERLQKQLSEANEVIENMKLCMDDKYDYDCVAEDVDIYLEKWGIK